VITGIWIYECQELDELDCISFTTKLASYSCEEIDGLPDDTHSIPDRYRVQVFRIGIQVFRIEVGVVYVALSMYIRAA
jgi:hypothetical protein